MAGPRFLIDVRRLARGEPAVNLELLFDELLDRRRPFSSEGLAGGPDFRALAVSLRTRELRVLADLVGMNPRRVVNSCHAMQVAP